MVKEKFEASLSNWLEKNNLTVNDLVRKLKQRELEDKNVSKTGVNPS